MGFSGIGAGWRLKKGLKGFWWIEAGLLVVFWIFLWKFFIDDWVLNGVLCLGIRMLLREKVLGLIFLGNFVLEILEINKISGIYSLSIKISSAISNFQGIENSNKTSEKSIPLKLSVTIINQG